MMNSLENLKNIKKWWLKNIYGIGKKIYWDNQFDTTFSGEYTLTSKKDKNGYIGIYNEKVGNRLVPYYYLESLKNVQSKPN